MYYIYHIPGKKIGVTTNPKIRVEKIQGYKKNEYEILLETNDINLVSEKEIELQKQYPEAKLQCLHNGGASPGLFDRWKSCDPLWLHVQELLTHLKHSLSFS